MATTKKAAKAKKAKGTKVVIKKETAPKMVNFNQTLEEGDYRRLAKYAKAMGFSTVQEAYRVINRAHLVKAGF